MAGDGGVSDLPLTTLRFPARTQWSTQPFLSSLLCDKVPCNSRSITVVWDGSKSYGPEGGFGHQLCLGSWSLLMCLEFCFSKSLCWSHPSQTEERLNPQLPGQVVYSRTYCVETGTTVSSSSISLLPLNMYQKTFYPIPSDFCLVLVTTFLQERILDVGSQKRTVFTYSPTTISDCSKISDFLLLDFRCSPVLSSCSIGPAELCSSRWSPAVHDKGAQMPHFGLLWALVFCLVSF